MAHVGQTPVKIGVTSEDMTNIHLQTGGAVNCRKVGRFLNERLAEMIEPGADAGLNELDSLLNQAASFFVFWKGADGHFDFDLQTPDLIAPVYRQGHLAEADVFAAQQREGGDSTKRQRQAEQSALTGCLRERCAFACTGQYVCGRDKVFNG